jgi:hypothetical protein
MNFLTYEERMLCIKLTIALIVLVLIEMVLT